MLLETLRLRLKAKQLSSNGLFSSMGGPVSSFIIVNRYFALSLSYRLIRLKRALR